MVARVGEAARKKTHAITREILEEDTSDTHFGEALRPALGHHTLCQLREKLLDFRRGEQSRGTGADAAQVHVAVIAPERVVQPGLRAALEALYEGRHVLSVRNLEKGLTVHGVDDIVTIGSDICPLAAGKVLQPAGRAACHTCKRINRRERFPRCCHAGCPQ